MRGIQGRYQALLLTYLHHEKISLTFHIGASTIEAQERIGEEILQIIKNHFE